MQKTPLYKEDLIEIIGPLLEKALLPIKEDINSLRQDTISFRQEVWEEFADIRNEIKSLRMFVERKFDALGEKFITLENTQERQGEEMNFLRSQLDKKIEYKDIPKVKEILHA